MFRANSSLEAVLLDLQTNYYQAKGRASEFLDSYANVPGPSREVLALGTCGSSSVADAWCIDNRGVLSLAVHKHTYQRLGIAGEPLPFKNSGHEFAIHIPLQDKSTGPFLTPHQQKAINAFDTTDLASSEQEWNIIFCCNGTDASTYQTLRSLTTITVTPEVDKMDNVHFPSSTRISRPQSIDDAIAWEEEVTALFEWVGMAALQSPRLFIHDHVDPYISVYEPPSHTEATALTHIRWRGLMPPQFVKKIVDAVADAPDGFAAITAHAFPNSPVTYVPPTSFKPDGPEKENLTTPFRSRQEGVFDVWSLVVSPLTNREKGYLLAESVAGETTRWG